MKNKYVIGGFLLPFIIECMIVGIAFVLLQIGVVASDCFEQYIPFFSIYYDKLKEGSSLFYSWNGSMGFDFWNVFCYYLVSPLNFLILLFPKSYIIYVVNFLILFKVALCGGTFSWYLQRKYKKNDWSISIFGLLFAFSGFLLGYAWNVMWLDSIVLFPILMASLDELIYKKKGNWYCLILAATILVNYFMGYMICIYILISFFTYAFKGWKDFFSSFIRIGYYSLISVGISAVILLPSFLGLNSTGISNETLPNLSFYGSFSTVLSTLGSFSIPIGISFDAERANLYIGEFALLLVFVFICSKQIEKREKMQKLILILFLIISCNFKPLNFIWHGFHEQRGIPNRFSFIIIFLMLEMAYEVWSKREEISKKEWKIGIGAYCIVMCILAKEIMYSFALAILIGLLFAKLIDKNKINAIRNVIIIEAIIMYIIAMCNCLGTVMSSYGEQIADFEYLSTYTKEGAYREKIDNTTNFNEIEWKENIQNLQIEDIDIAFVKNMYSLITDIGHLSVMNEGSIYGIHAMTLFNTFNNKNLSEIYQKSGGQGSDSYVGYFGENSFMDMILGVKYAYNRYGIINSFAYKLIATSGKVNLYENKYALSLGYTIPCELWEEKDLLKSNPFQTMNQMSRNIVGEDVYDLRKFTLEEVVGCTKETFTGVYGYFTEFVRGEAQVILSYEAKEKENLIFQLCNQEMYLSEIYINEECILRGKIHREMIDLGMLQQGDQVKVVLTFSKEYDKAGLYLYAATLKQDVMLDVYELLSREQMEVVSFEEDCIKGTIFVEEDTPVLITIPYKAGWKFVVDGEEMQIQDLWGGAFPVLELTSGKHEIICSYKTPMFTIGRIISITSLFLYIIQLKICLKKQYKFHKKYDKIKTREK